MQKLDLALYAFVYAGMLFGGLPGFALDRTGVALLGAIVLLVANRLTPEAAWLAIDIPTIALLLGLMIVSAQFRLGGAYAALTRRIARAEVSPSVLLLTVILAAGALSALLANDIVCLAMAPLLVEGCLRRGLRPLPFLLALACAANVGSAATLIGNPQNMLIGQTLHLSFAGYLLDGGIPAVLGCLATWWIIRRQFAAQWTGPTEEHHVAAPPFNAWQTAKGVAVLVGLVAGFLFTPWPRELLALAAGGLLLLSRRMHTHRMLGLVDWHLLVLFAGLFIVNHTLVASGLLGRWLAGLTSAGVQVEHPAWLFGITAVLSNLISNVPAVMLLLPAATHPAVGAAPAESHAFIGAILALASTLAGNLFIVGSIANIIVVDQAQRLGIRITWAEHARTGVPVTLATLAIAAAWLYFRALL